MISKKLFLQCYPNRDIYESRVGQNWQLLVPAASYSLCGYIDNDLYYIYEHNDSHSRKRRSYIEQYKRWDGFEELLIKSLQASRYNEDIFVHRVKENCARQKFYYAVSEKNKSVMKNCILQIKKNGKVSLKEYLLFLKKYFF